MFEQNNPTPATPAQWWNIEHMRFLVGVRSETSAAHTFLRLRDDTVNHAFMEGVVVVVNHADTTALAMRDGKLAVVPIAEACALLNLLADHSALHARMFVTGKPGTKKPNTEENQ